MNTMQNVSDCRNASRISPSSGMAGFESSKVLPSWIESRDGLSVGRWRSLGMAAFAAAALTAVFVVASRSAEAGPAFEIWATEYGDDSTNADDMLVQTPVRWPSDRQPVPIVLYQALNGSIIAPNSNPEGIGADGEDTVRQALRRAIEAWNDVDNSSFKFERNIRYSTYLEGARDFLPFGPYQSMIDTFNLVTFQDPNYPVLPDGVLAATNVFYIQRDFDLTGVNVAIPGAIIQQLTGGVDAIVVDGQLQPNLFLPHRSYEAGEILEADIIMDSEYNAWKAYPEDPDDLSSDIPRDTIRGDIDLQAVFTRELGHVAGLTNTLLRLPVMASTYRSKNSPLEDVRVWERADPWEARELQLDDKLGMAQAYPTSGYWSSAGIEGAIRDGRAYDADADNPLPYVPDIGVFFGRHEQPPEDEDLLVELDLVNAQNVGSIRLEAMTVSGRGMKVPGSTGESSYYDSQSAWVFFLVPNFWTRFGATANGNFELHGLPAGSEWYVYVNTDSAQYNWTWDFGNRGLFGQIATAPEEFYGGVDIDRPLPGDGSALDDNSLTDPIFANNYLLAVLTPTLQTGFALAGSRVSGSGGGYIQAVSDDESFGEIGIVQTGKDVRYYRNQNRPYGVDAATVEIDQFMNEAKGDGLIATATGDRLIQTLVDVKLASFRDDVIPRHFLVDVTLVNKSRERLGVNFSYVHRANNGLGDANEAVLFADDSPVLREKGYGFGFADPLPADFRYLDVEDNPSAVALYRVQGDDVTTPQSVVVGSFQEIQKKLMANYEPRGVDLFTTVFGAVQVNDVGILYRYSPVTLDPGTSDTIHMVVSFQRFKDSMALRDGPVGTTNPDQIYLDYPFTAYPIPLISGQTVDNVILYTNTGIASLLFDYFDWDGDGVENDIDNCPWVPNPDQEANEATLPRGMACLADYDGDGIDDSFDNCFSYDPLFDYPNFDQADSDGDDIGDACDDDMDNDGIDNEEDNCPFVYNPIPPGRTTQVDSDGNSIGDACEDDYDGDGVPNDYPDNCERIPNPNQEDSDEDDIGDACDPDIDGDGVDNINDNCPTVPNPLGENDTAQADEDEDGIGDACENIGVTIEYERNRLDVLPLAAKGAAFGDLNGDGYIDIVLAVSGLDNDNSSNLNRILMNQGYRGKPGYFVDETFGLNGTFGDGPASDQLGSGDNRLPSQFDNTWDVKLADFDLDGDLDIYFSNFSSFTNPSYATSTGQYGQEDRLLINVDLNDPTKNPNVDNDDLGDGFFVDATDIAVPGILNTKGMVGPNPLSRQFYSDYDHPVYTQSTRSEIQDIDSDGDPDIILSVENPYAAGRLGYLDLAGTRYLNLLADPLYFSEMILINRRDELRIDDGTPGGKPMPRGTPDAFLAFMEQNENLKRRSGFSPDPDPEDFFQPNLVEGQFDTSFGDLLSESGVGTYLGRRLDRYFFRDETLGRDGVFGGSFRSRVVDRGGQLMLMSAVDYRNCDRLPSMYPDQPDNNSPYGPGVDEADFSMTREVASVNLTYGPGPDIVVANRWLNNVGGYGTSYRANGYIPLYANLDVHDKGGNFESFDWIDDGYFTLVNFNGEDLLNSYGPATFVLNENPRFGRFARLNIPDGFPLDIASPEADIIPRTQFNNQGVLVGDLNYSGSNEFIGYPDASASTIYSTIAPGYSSGANFWRGQNNTLYGAGLDSYADFNGAWTFFWTTHEGLPGKTGRTLHAALCDLNNDGSLDILMAQDGPLVGGTPIDEYHFTNGFGPQQFIQGNGFAYGASSWQDLSPSTLIPSRAVFSGSFVAAGDVDNDGDQDVLFVDHLGQSRLYMNQLYEYKPRPDQYVPPAPGKPALPSNFINTVDLGLAGEPSLFYDGTHLTLPPYADNAAGLNTSSKDAANVTCAVQTADVDRDGDSDLVFINGGDSTEQGDRNLMLINHGVSSRPYAVRVFSNTNRSFPAPRLMNSSGTVPFMEDDTRPGYDAAFFDYDQDGDVDLFCTYFQDRLRLYENRDADDPRLFDNALRIKNLSTDPKFFNTLNDYDTDPRDATSFDQYNAALGFSRLARATVELGDGNFEDVTDDVDMPAGGKIEQTGSPAGMFSTRPGIGDVDGDTFIDVVVPQNLNSAGSPNKLFLNKLPVGLEGDARARRFSNFSYLLPEAPVVSVDGTPNGSVAGLYDATAQAVVADFDGDGDVDLLFVNQKASEPDVEDPASTSYRPNFVWWSRLLINQGGRQNGEMGQFVDASDFVDGHVRNRTDTFYHRSYTSAKVYDLNQDGDYCEDADGNGVVTDEEILAFENLIEAKNALEGGDFYGNPITDSFQDIRIRYQDETTVYTGGVQGKLKPPVDQVIPLSRLSEITRSEVPHDDNLESNRDRSALWRRKPRWIDRNNNGQCDPSYDMVLTSSDGLGLTILLNNNDGTFRDVTDAALDFEQKQITHGVDVADVDLDGVPDIVGCFETDTLDAPTVLLFWGEISRGALAYQDVSETALPQEYVIRVLSPNSGASTGASRAIKVSDIDGDGDFDLVIGNQGRRIGAAWWGCPNQVLLNRIRGGSWNTRTGLFVSRVAGTGGPVIENRLKVSSVLPRLAMRGTESVALSVYGVNFKNGVQIYLGDGIHQVKPPIVRTGQILEVTVEIDADAVPGPRAVVVKNPDGESAQSRGDAFIVTAPELVVQQPSDPAVANPRWYHYE